MYSKKMVNAMCKQNIEQCFKDMYIVTRFDVKQHFREYKECGKLYDIVRALVYLEHVAKNPEQYFAPEYTLDAWNKRLDEKINSRRELRDAVREYGIDKVRYNIRGSFGETPHDIVWRSIDAAVRDDALLDFCSCVEDFYYRDIDPTRKQNYFGFILEYSKEMAELSKIVQRRDSVNRKIMNFLNPRLR